MTTDVFSIHATTVKINSHAVILRGPSGAGKSDLALRLIDVGAQLISDDQTGLFIENNILYARSANNLSRLIEVRGLGILTTDPAPPSAVGCIIDLMPGPRPDKEENRLPPPQTTPLLGQNISLFQLYPFDLSAVIKVKLALGLATGTQLRHDK